MCVCACACVYVCDEEKDRVSETDKQAGKTETNRAEKGTTGIN